MKLSVFFTRLAKKLKKQGRVILPDKRWSLTNFEVDENQFIDFRITRVPETDNPECWYVMIGDEESVETLETMWQTAVMGKVLGKIKAHGGKLPPGKELN